MMEAGYPKANCPRDNRKLIMKLYLEICDES